MRYAKLHGCQNAYVYVTARDLGAADPADTARRVAATPAAGGIGSDGLIVHAPTRDADVRMVMYNADGSRAAMCGNGVRALAKWVLDNDARAGKMLAHGKSLDEVHSALGDLRSAFDRILCWMKTPCRADFSVRLLTVATDSGVKPIVALLVDGRVIVASVDVGLAQLSLANLGSVRPRTSKPHLLDEPMTVADEQFAITCVDVGNLHAVAFVPDVGAVALPIVGRALECHELFPDRANIHFATIESRTRIIMRPWERGSGATAACGTGACAVLAAAAARGAADLECEVVQPGGSVCVCLEPVADLCWRAHLVGPAELVETGSWPR